MGVWSASVVWVLQEEAVLCVAAHGIREGTHVDQREDESPPAGEDPEANAGNEGIVVNAGALVVVLDE